MQRGINKFKNRNTGRENYLWSYRSFHLNLALLLMFLVSLISYGLCITLKLTPPVEENLLFIQGKHIFYQCLPEKIIHNAYPKFYFHQLFVNNWILLKNYLYLSKDLRSVTRISTPHSLISTLKLQRVFMFDLI